MEAQPAPSAFDNPGSSRLTEDVRTTESITFAITQDDYDELTNPDFIEGMLGRFSQYTLFGYPGNDNGMNCSSVAVEILKEIKIYAFDGCTTPNLVAKALYTIVEEHESSGNIDLGKPILDPQEGDGLFEKILSGANDGLAMLLSDFWYGAYNSDASTIKGGIRRKQRMAAMNPDYVMHLLGQF